jgi:hypothetical protein
MRAALVGFTVVAVAHCASAAMRGLVAADMPPAYTDMDREREARGQAVGGTPGDGVNPIRPRNPGGATTTAAADLPDLTGWPDLVMRLDLLTWFVGALVLEPTRSS